MLDWFFSIIQTIAVLSATSSAPAIDKEWTHATAWKFDEKTNIATYEASSSQIIEKCTLNPNLKIESPILPQSVQEFWIDGKMIYNSGDRSFKTASTFYNHAKLPCTLVSGKEMTWKVFASGLNFTSIRHFPRVAKISGWKIIFTKTQPIAVAGGILVLGLIGTVVFRRNISTKILISFVISSLLFGLAFILYVPVEFGIDLSLAKTIKIADLALWGGFVFNIYLLHQLNIADAWITRASLSVYLFVSFIIIGSKNLDQEQLGSNIMMLFVLSIYFYLLTKGIATAFLRKQKVADYYTSWLGVALFTGLGIHDILNFQNIIQSVPLFPIAVLCTSVLVGLSVNNVIASIHTERDYLKGNLEKEVQNKTSELQIKSEELTLALNDLKGAQADLVQSAKLAALGTLSAGIAHEINNALNYVNGSIGPIAKIIDKDVLEETDRKKAKNLIALMKDGLEITFQIIKNLKRQTNLSASEVEALSLIDIIKDVLMLVNVKSKDINIVVDVNPDIKIKGQRVAVWQVVMNIISNAIDAIEMENASISSQLRKIKEIRISSGIKDNFIFCEIEDNGPGISDKVKDRIFEPFFTTKPVGKGTGLGLHIVTAELKKMGGNLILESTVGKGTKFTLYFPRLDEVAAA